MMLRIGDKVQSFHEIDGDPVTEPNRPKATIVGFDPRYEGSKNPLAILDQPLLGHKKWHLSDLQPAAKHRLHKKERLAMENLAMRRRIYPRQDARMASLLRKRGAIRRCEVNRAQAWALDRMAKRNEVTREMGFGQPVWFLAGMNEDEKRPYKPEGCTCGYVLLADWRFRPDECPQCEAKKGLTFTGLSEWGVEDWLVRVRISGFVSHREAETVARCIGPRLVYDATEGSLTVIGTDGREHHIADHQIEVLRIKPEAFGGRLVGFPKDYEPVPLSIAEFRNHPSLCKAFHSYCYAIENQQTA